MTREEVTNCVQDIRAELQKTLRCVSRPEPDWEGAAKAIDTVNLFSCELWQGCLRESWKVDGRGETP